MQLRPTHRASPIKRAFLPGPTYATIRAVHGMALALQLGGSHERTAERRRQISGTTDQSLRLCLLGVGGAGGPRIRQGSGTPLRTLCREGKALAIKYREMVIIGILAFRGASQEGMLAHMRRAIQHGATKRELLEAIESAAVPGGGPTLPQGCARSCSSTPRGHSRTGKGRPEPPMLLACWC